MPKRGGQRNYNNGGISRNNDGGACISAIKGGGGFQNSSHDEQKQRNSTRRVSFKPSPLQHKGGVRARLSDAAIRSRLAEDDDMMHEIAIFNDKYDDMPLPRRKGSPIPRGKFGNGRKLVPNSYGWYQVTIHNGQLYSKDDVLRVLLAAMSPHIFQPQYWRIEKSCIIFFIDNFETADIMQQMGRNAQMPDGFRLMPRVRSGFPVITVDDELKEKMKVVMARRYNAATKALDLSKFHADPELKNCFCPLFRAPVMSAAIDIIESNIPDLEALNLNENNLSTLDSFRHVDKRLPNLKIIYLADNKLVSLQHILVFRNLPLVEVMLKNNSFGSRYRDHQHYISEVRRKLPKIQKLDGEVLDQQILFDMNESSKLPASQPSFLCDANGMDIVRQFLEQYFTIYDTDNRQPLLNAYHEQAMLSMSVPPASQAGRLCNYWKYNRNFRRIVSNDRDNKTNLIKTGRLAIVTMLTELPKTYHDRETFSVDLTLFTPAVITFTVTGLFREFDTEAEGAAIGVPINHQTSYELRFFVRTFFIVPQGSGFCISNELILISNPTYDQMRHYKQVQSGNMPGSSDATSTVTSTITSNSNAPSALGVAPSGSLQSRLQFQDNYSTMMPTQMIPSTATTLMPNAANTMMSAPQMNANANIAATMIAAGQPGPDETTKMQMVQAIAAQSNMNLEWSKKCLEETNWDYNHAAFVFDNLLKQGKIPPEAFVK